MKLFHILFIIFLEFYFSCSSTIEDVRLAFKEVAYSYYMRGKFIQYNHNKQDFFPPEEATSQSRRFLVCSAFVKAVYQELLNITLPPFTSSLLNYSRTNQGSPEVIAYSAVNGNNDHNMTLYSPDENKYKTIINPSVQDIMDFLEIGDILTYTGGHTFLVYDILRDSKGKATEAIIIEATGGKSYVNSKISRDYTSHYLYLNKKFNSDFEEGLEEGSVGLNNFSTYEQWTRINRTKSRIKEYSILRFIHKNSNEDAILKYKSAYSDELKNNDKIILSSKNNYRTKFKHLYIEKTVDKFNGNVVELGEILTYTIRVKNFDKNNYIDNLIITENHSSNVIFRSYSTQNSSILYEYNLEKKEITWDIGKLKSKEEIIINYSVNVTNGEDGEIIESIGRVGNIDSSTIRNVIGKNLDINQQELIKKAYEKNKNSKYDGKDLINHIYEDAFGIDTDIDVFDIDQLIINSKINSDSYKTLYLNKKHPFYKTILNKYWSSMVKTNNGDIDIYDLKLFRSYSDPERRQDFIYSEIFKTGDILIYINNNDFINSKEKITNENGEYSYIYIEGKGFVGVNKGRNEFNAKYYSDNNLDLFKGDKITDSQTLEIGNLQTLFGKDYYVIIRPSLRFNFRKDGLGNHRNLKASDSNGAKTNDNQKIFKLNYLLLFSIIIFIL